MIPYSPLLHLVESYEAVYKIYVLKDPFTGEVFYVGQTSMDLGTRLSGHLSTNSGNILKSEFIKSITSRGSKPIIEAVETIRGLCYIDKMIVNQREIYWIKFYKAQGIKILNSALMASDAECKEYNEYLAAVRSGQSSYRYYYCGKTKGGISVYDEEKLKADGFKLPVTDKPKEKIVEKVIVQTEYILRPSVKTDIFPPMPQWSPAFLKEMPPANYFMEDLEMDDSDWESIDELETIGDFEVEHEGEDMIEAETLDISTHKKQLQAFLEKCKEDNPDYIKQSIEE